MYCPFCLTQYTKVIDSRLVDNGCQVKRRRVCSECQARFTTYEVAELVMPTVVKSDGRRKPFDEQKLRRGLLKALEKRPVSLNSIEEMVSSIKLQIRSGHEREVPATVIGELVMKHLKVLDHVAYVRFASVYKCFEDISEFSQAIQDLDKESKV